MSNCSGSVQTTAPKLARILIVDDLVDAADSLARVLGRLGYEVRAVYDGASAVTAAEDFLPNAILLDLALPQLDGFQVAAQIRQRVRLQSVCLIAVSGFGQAGDLELTRAAGFNFHLIKPVNLAELQQHLSMLPRSRA